MCKIGRQPRELERVKEKENLERRVRVSPSPGREISRGMRERRRGEGKDDTPPTSVVGSVCVGEICTPVAQHRLAAQCVTLF